VERARRWALKSCQFAWLAGSSSNPERLWRGSGAFPQEATVWCRMIPSPVFHGLLYIDERENQHVNLKGSHNGIDIYLRCAALCASSVRFHGCVFRLITNDRAYVQRRLGELQIPQCEVVEPRFTLDVPRGIRFYGAHFKLEVYTLFGKGAFGDWLGLIDIDSVMTAPINFPELSPETLIGYDITDQVTPAYGVERIRSDVERLTRVPTPRFRWLGGEFLFGHADSFRVLSNAMASLWLRYLDEIENLHHVGDEMLLCASAHVLPELRILDGGKLGFVARWWSARTPHRQPPFAAIRSRSILHLPSDKPFLAAFSGAEFHPSTFISAYERAVAGKLTRRRLLNGILRRVKRDRKFAACLS